MKKYFYYLLPVLILAAIVMICFHRTLASYFIADDFGQIAYTSEICKGDIQSLLSNFTGNYMQNPVMKIYRPCLLISFLLDYLIWHTKAFGYFLTNILWLIAASVMLFHLLRALTKYWDNQYSFAISILGAALFASNPLHCESISFVSGRDNVISSFFYLLTFWSFIKRGESKNKTLLIIGCISFWLAMLSKETAIGMPLVLFGFVFFMPELFQYNLTTGIKISIKDRFKLAFSKSLVLWLNALAYLLVRFFTLGTVSGGYVGSIGAGLMNNCLTRWAGIDTIFRIIYPISEGSFDVFTPYYITVLSILYAALVTLILVRFFSAKHSLKLFGLLSLWIISTIAPTYQLWGLGENLEGARFFFFLSIPLAIIFPLALLSPQDKTVSPASNIISKPTSQEHKTALLAIMLMCVLVIFTANITYKNNIPWIHAGKQTKACMKEAQRLAQSVSAGKKIAIIGLPKEQYGAHIIHNGPTFNVMMSPPFSPENYYCKFITFEPIFYNGIRFINAHNLRTALLDKDVSGLFAWNKNKLAFDKLPMPDPQVLNRENTYTPIKFKFTDVSTAVMASNEGAMHHIIHRACLSDHKLLIAPSNIDPYKYDYLELTLKTKLPAEMMFVFWKGLSSDTLEYWESKHPVQKLICGANNSTKIRIRLSDRWRWYTKGNIDRLELEFVPGQQVQIQDMQLVCDKDLAPTIAVADIKPSNIGVYKVKKAGLYLNFDARAIKNAEAVKIEISHPNYFLEGLEPKDESYSIMTTLTASKLQGQFFMPNSLFIPCAYHQIRAFCVDKKGLLIGEKSNPITLEAENPSLMCMTH